MVATVVKIESRSFSSAETQHFRTENTRSDYRETYHLYVTYYFTGINYYKLAVEKDHDSIFTPISYPEPSLPLRPYGNQALSVTQSSELKTDCDVDIREICNPMAANFQRLSFIMSNLFILDERRGIRRIHGIHESQCNSQTCQGTPTSYILYNTRDGIAC